MRYTSQRQFFCEVNMLIKTLFVILTLSVLSTLAQNSNVSIETATKPASNKPASTRPKPTPTPTPIPSNTTIRGKVFYEDDGKSVRRSVVVFFKTGSGRESQTLTDENGNFEIHNVQAGSYFPMLISGGAVNLFSNLDLLNKDFEQSLKLASKGFQEIIVDGKTNLEVKIPVKRGGAISGKVTYYDGTPAGGRPIQVLKKVNGKFQPVILDISAIFRASSGFEGIFETDDRGMYRFSGLPAGDYFIRIIEPTIHGTSFESYKNIGPNSAMGMMFASGTFLNTYYPQTISADEAKPIKVDVGKEQSDINITIPNWKLSEVSGNVVSSKDGKPVRANVYINRVESSLPQLPLTNLDTYSSSVGTDENGNWSFRNIPKGEYVIRVEPWGESQYNYVSSGKPAKVERYAKVSQNVTVENSNVEKVEIKTYLSPSISGTVILPKEIEIAENMKFTANLNIQIINEKNEIVEQEWVSLFDSENGELNPQSKIFKIEGLSKEKFKLKVDTLGENIEVKSATAKGIDLLNNFIELKEGQVLSNVRIVLEKKK